MRGYFGIGQLSASDKQDILNQHKSVYNGYQTMQPEVSNTQPLYVYDDISDKEGFVVNNKGEVKKYTNMGINEQVETKEVCDECGSMIMDGVCEQCYMEEELGEDDGPSFFDQAKDFVMSNPEILMALEEDSDEVCECGGSMYEGVCNECGSGYMEEETGHLDDIYDEEDLNPTAGFDYIEGSSNDVDTFEGMHKKLYESKKIHDSKLKSKIKNFIVKHSKIKNIEILIDDLSDDKLIEKIEGYAKMSKFSELNKVADDLFKQLKKSRKETNESDADEFVNYDDNMEDDDDFQDYESSYTQDGVDDPDNEDDGYEDLNASEVTDEIEEQGGNVDDMDDDDVQPAYTFDSNGPGDVYPVNEIDDDDMYSYEPMESAFADDELEEGDIYGDPEFTETDVSGVQGIYGAMDRAYDFNSDGPGKAGPYQEFSYESEMDEDEDFDATEDDFKDVDEDLKESFLIQKNKITEMFNRFNRYN